MLRTRMPRIAIPRSTSSSATRSDAGTGAGPSVTTGSEVMCPRLGELHEHRAVTPRARGGASPLCYSQVANTAFESGSATYVLLRSGMALARRDDSRVPPLLERGGGHAMFIV